MGMTGPAAAEGASKAQTGTTASWKHGWDTHLPGIRKWQGLYLHSLSTLLQICPYFSDAKDVCSEKDVPQLFRGKIPH